MERRDLFRTIVAVGVASAPTFSGLAVAQPLSERPLSERRVAMSKANEAAVRYLAAWNETEPRRRRELVAKAWTDDGTYIDSAREGRGHDSLDAMIATAQGHFPGYRLRLASGIEAHHEYLRFSWEAGGTAEAPLYIKGTDFVVLVGDGRIKSVVGFIDAAPARS
jgi:SnoaL-like domain